MVYNELFDLPETCVIVDPHDPSRQRKHGPESKFEDLLVPAIRSGKRTGVLPQLSDIRRRAAQQISNFHHTILRLDNPHYYPVGLEQQLHELKTEMVHQLRQIAV